MPVAKTTSPVTSPGAPKEMPFMTVPFCKTKYAVIAYPWFRKKALRTTILG